MVQVDRFRLAYSGILLRSIFLVVNLQGLHVLSSDTPEVWSASLAAASSEAQATDLLQDINWPITWLSEQQIMRFAYNGWWELLGRVIVHADNLCHESESGEGSGMRLLLAVDAGIRHVLGEMVPFKDEQHALKLLRMVNSLHGKQHKAPPAWSYGLSAAETEGAALAKLDALDWPVDWVDSSQFANALARQWWDFVEALVNRTIQAVDSFDGDALGERRLIHDAKSVDVSLRDALDVPLLKDLSWGQQHRVYGLLRRLGSVSGLGRRPPLPWLRVWQDCHLEVDAAHTLATFSWPVLWLTEIDLERMVSRGWWGLLKQVVAYAVHEPYFAAEHDTISMQTSKFVDSTLRKAVGTLRLEADQLLKSLDPNFGRPSVIRPALRWAQGSAIVHINVKYAVRFNAPGALQVENIKVEFDSFGLHFSADGEHSNVRKFYDLNLHLYGGIDPSKSTWRTGSVGKMSITLAKLRPSRWPRLLNDSAKVANIHIWHDYQEKLQDELDKLGTD